VGIAERQSLADRLDRTWAPVGRRWAPVKPRQTADLRFVSGPPGEAYTLTVDSSGVTVAASEPAGRFYALVTLAQLFPPRARAVEAVTVAGGKIVDRPAYPWRGLMVDSARHFQSVAALEGILELMALHKLNRFHWHLTDDQGWRLEVPGWPLLTAVGAWRTEGGQAYGGFYTAADVRRVVAFAALRHIEVVPEVDVPGHSSAALAAYPELSASGKPRPVPTDWAVADGVLSVGRPAVKRFTGDILATLVDLFPGPYIHWGGDEVFRHPFLQNPESLAWMRLVKASTADQAVAAFWNDLARRTLAAGKVPYGWDDVAASAPPAGTLIQWWDDPARARNALEAGYSVVASWKETTYLDYPEWDGDGDRAWWMPVQTLGRVASQPFWPPGTPVQARSHLVGVEATLFTERAPEPRLGRKLFPRLALVAELAWRGVVGGVPGWPARIEAHRTRLAAWGVGMPPPVR
jgi:hexosaminidase